MLTPKEEKRGDSGEELPVGAVPHSVKRAAISVQDVEEYWNIFQSIETSAQPTVKKRRETLSPKYEYEYLVDRIMCRVGDRFLVSWSGWNFTYCSYCTMEDLKHSPEIMKNFLIYDKGIDAIYKNINNTRWYSQVEERTKKKIVFQRQFVHQMKKMGDKKLTELLSAPAKHKDLGQLKYWRIKHIELEWLKVLNRNSNLDYPPLYLESMSPKNRKVPQIEFMIYFRFSEAANRFFYKKEHSHKCIYGSPDKYCKDCKMKNFIVTKLDPETLSDVIIPENMTKTCTPVVIICNEFDCSCPHNVDGSACCRYLPPYPRKVPLVVFYDIRYQGYGIRALTDIPKGRIVSEYVGEVLVESEVEGKDCTYQMQANGLVIDAKFKGNESRFFGHSCEPNLAILAAYVDGYCMEHLHRFIIVTIRDIKAGEDMTFDYHPNQQKPSKGYGRCDCGTPSCRGWL